MHLSISFAQPSPNLRSSSLLLYTDALISCFSHDSMLWKLDVSEMDKLHLIIVFCFLKNIACFHSFISQWCLMCFLSMTNGSAVQEPGAGNAAYVKVH
jgi:hypothetical protein